MPTNDRNQLEPTMQLAQGTAVAPGDWVLIECEWELVETVTHTVTRGRTGPECAKAVTWVLLCIEDEDEPTLYSAEPKGLYLIDRPEQ